MTKILPLNGNFSTLSKRVQSQSQKLVNQSQTKTNHLKMQLFALAALGATMLTSCSKSDILRVNNEYVVNTNKVEFADPLNTYYNLDKKVDNAMSFLGLLQEPASSIYDIKTFSFNDEKGNEYYFQPTLKNSRYMDIVQINIRDNIYGEKYRLSLNSSENGIELTRKDEKDNIINKSNFVLENNKIVEYKNIDEVLVENSILYPNNNGGFIQEFSNGEIKTYSNIKNNEEMPQQIDFEVGVDGWNGK